MNTYNWQTLALYTADFANEQGYVVNVRYRVTATDGVYNSEIELSAIFEELVNDPNYIPYSQLTNAIVMGWCQQQMGSDQVQVIYNTLDQQIENQINPPQTPTSKPLPF
jgi:hypothetical protein